ncbi:hypothetical protein PRZ48_015021 [Zasmidium cellare]|uniref:Uncharacterized protein n=1 Tax=Zasmidium cellare TaxID=395010 RepID=A0ABR0DXV0_ZASCE|nr:hypothetical protein PRZ48_015021 [Zasmidium cellare]
MLFPIPTLTLLLTTAHAAAIITASDIISGVAAVDSAVVTFKQHIIAYNGGYLNQTPLVTDLATILTTTATLDAQSALLLSNFTPSDSTRLVEFYASTLGQDVPSTGKALLEKRDLIVGMGEGEGVALAQKGFQIGLDGFAGEVEGRLTAAVGEFESAAERVHGALEEGYVAFSVV